MRRKRGKILIKIIPGPQKSMEGTWKKRKNEYFYNYTENIIEQCRNEDWK